MGIFEAELQFWDQVDLDLFFANLTHGRIPNGTHPEDNLVDGGVAVTTNISAAGGEAMLDLEVISINKCYPQIPLEGITDKPVALIPDRLPSDHHRLERRRPALSDLGQRYLHLGFQHPPRRHRRQLLHLLSLRRNRRCSRNRSYIPRPRSAGLQRDAAMRCLQAYERLLPLLRR
jgi:hypothetical protein